MNLASLSALLTTEGFRAQYYTLDGTSPLSDAGLTLSSRHGEWVIESCERDVRTILGRYDSESMACEKMYELMRMYCR